MVDGVTKRYEVTGTWDVINDIITSNISDPLTGREARASTAEWIKNGFPNPAKLDQAGGWKFPLIVIALPNLDTVNMVVDASKQSITNTVTITCYARTRLQAAQLAEEIKSYLQTDAQSELRKACLHGPDVTNTSHDSDFIGANKHYFYEIDYEFKRFD